jgi:hypothetical protein
MCGVVERKIYLESQLTMKFIFARYHWQVLFVTICLQIKKESTCHLQRH